jgi:hypothetical protein
MTEESEPTIADNTVRDSEVRFPAGITHTQRAERALRIVEKRTLAPKEAVFAGQHAR